MNVLQQFIKLSAFALNTLSEGCGEESLHSWAREENFRKMSIRLNVPLENFLHTEWNIIQGPTFFARK